MTLWHRNVRDSFTPGDASIDIVTTVGRHTHWTAQTISREVWRWQSCTSGLTVGAQGCGLVAVREDNLESTTAFVSFGLIHVADASGRKSQVTVESRFSAAVQTCACCFWVARILRHHTSSQEKFVRRKQNKAGASEGNDAARFYLNMYCEIPNPLFQLPYIPLLERTHTHTHTILPSITANSGF